MCRGWITAWWSWVLCHQPCLLTKVSAVAVNGKKSKDLWLGMDFQGETGRSGNHSLSRKDGCDGGNSCRTWEEVSERWESGLCVAFRKEMDWVWFLLWFLSVPRIWILGIERAGARKIRVIEHWMKEWLVWYSWAVGCWASPSPWLCLFWRHGAACEHSPHVPGFEAVGTAVPIFIWFSTSELIFSYFTCKNWTSAPLSSPQEKPVELSPGSVLRARSLPYTRARSDFWRIWFTLRRDGFSKEKSILLDSDFIPLTTLNSFRILPVVRDSRSWMLHNLWSPAGSASLLSAVICKYYFPPSILKDIFISLGRRRRIFLALLLYQFCFLFKINIKNNNSTRANTISVFSSSFTHSLKVLELQLCYHLRP